MDVWEKNLLRKWKNWSRIQRELKLVLESYMEGYFVVTSKWIEFYLMHPTQVSV